MKGIISTLILLAVVILLPEISNAEDPSAGSGRTHGSVVQLGESVSKEQGPLTNKIFTMAMAGLYLSITGFVTIKASSSAIHNIAEEFLFDEKENLIDAKNAKQEAEIAHENYLSKQWNFNSAQVEEVLSIFNGLKAKLTDLEVNLRLTDEAIALHSEV